MKNGLKRSPTGIDSNFVNLYRFYKYTI